MSMYIIILFYSFIDKLKLFESVLLVQFGCLSYTLMIALIIMKYMDWFAIYPFTAVVVFQIAMYSVIGTYIESKVLSSV